MRMLVEHGSIRAMGRYQKKQVTIEAVQWFKHGDHPAVLAENPDDDFGYIETPEGRLKVIPSDWIITGVAGENYPCKAEIFEQTYARVD